MQHSRVIIFIILIAVLLTAGCSSQPEQKAPTLTPDQLKSQAIAVSYDDMLRHPDNYIGKIVHFTGGVIQANDGDKNNYYLRVNTRPSSSSPNWYLDDDVLLRWGGEERYLEKDLIEFWEYYTGPKKYTTVLGAERTVPEIDAQLIYHFDQKNEYTPQLMPTMTTEEITPLSVSPSQLSGSGDDVVSFTATGAGLAIFTLGYSGEHNFIVWLENSNGEKLNLLANKIRAYSGKTSQKLSPGKYIVDVKASGPWMIDIS